MTGAQFEISVDGKPRSYRDAKPIATEAAELLKSRNPNCEVAVKDLQSGQTTAVAFKPVKYSDSSASIGAGFRQGGVVTEGGNV